MTNVALRPARLAEPAPEFPLVPRGWYYVAPLELLRRPFEMQLGGREYVAFATHRQAHVLDGRCPHFSSRLARGTLVGDCLQCPLHGWRFRADGSCAGTPSGEVPPTAARVVSYPTAVLGGHVFFHTDSGNVEPLPFFPGVAAGDLISAPPFAFEVEMPWWLASANGFDAQHFLAAHDRRLVGTAEMLRDDTVFEARSTFDVAGHSWRDRATRLFSGPRVEMTVRNAGGTLVLVTSRFRRSTTFGLVSIRPLSATRSHVQAVIWMHRRAAIGRALDALDVRVRANFIRAFLQPDIEAGEGIRYEPSRAIEADALLVRYLRWLGTRE